MRRAGIASRRRRRGVRHRLVEAMRALAAAEDQQGEARARRRRRRSRTGAPDCRSAPPWSAGKYALASGKVDADAPRQPGEGAVGHAGMRVLLEQHGRECGAASAASDDRERGVAADADHHVGAEFAERCARRAPTRRGQLRSELQRAAPAAAAQAADRHGTEGEARLRDDPRLDAVARCRRTGRGCGSARRRISATARPGNRCPPVPPPATIIRILNPSCATAPRAAPTSSIVTSSAEPP